MLSLGPWSRNLASLGKMAGNVEVHLSKETKLLSPPLPSEVEARKDSIAVTEGTVKIDVSTSHR